MNEKNMILEAIEKAPNPLMVKDIVKYIYNFFDGYVISKKDVKSIIWGELKNEIVFNKINFTYSSVNKQMKFNSNPTDLHILNDIKEAIGLIENPNDLTVQKITNILNHSLFKQYNLYDIRKLFNKHDIAIFEHYHKINFEKQRQKKIDQTYLDDIDLPTLKVNKYNLDGYNLIIEGASNELGPLFWVKAEGLNINIYVNILHPKFQKEKEEFIVPMIVAIVRTSLSFSDNNGEIFINRFKNYLELV
jgi:hypothetical protein